MIALKEKLDNFFSLLLETRDTIIQLNKYKGNVYYKNKFLDKVKEINRSFRFLRTEIGTNGNKDLKIKFKKIEGDVQTILEYKNPESSLEEIGFIEDFWPEIELAIQNESIDIIERIYDKGSRFDFHLDIKSILHSSKKNLFIIDSWINEDLLELYIKNLPNNLNIRILAGDKPKGKLVKIGNMFNSQYGNKLEVRENPFVHDRCVFCDLENGWVIGQSIKDGGKKPTYIIKLRDPTKLKNIYEGLWVLSKKII